MLGQVTTANDALTQNAYLHMGLSYLQLAEKTRHVWRSNRQPPPTPTCRLRNRPLTTMHFACTKHPTPLSVNRLLLEKFLNEFPTSPYAEKVSNYLVEVYEYPQLRSCFKVNRTDRQAGHRSWKPNKDSLPTGYYSHLPMPISNRLQYLNQSIAIGAVQPPNKGGRLLLVRESYYRLNRMMEAARDFNAYLQLTTQPNNEMYALANYNLGYIAFHRGDYTQAKQLLPKYPTGKGENRTALADAYKPYRRLSSECTQL